MSRFPVAPTMPTLPKATPIPMRFATPPRPSPRGPSRAIPKVTVPTFGLPPSPLKADPTPRRRWLR